MTKTCANCESVKPLEEFYTSPNTRSGRTSWCKTCYRARYKERNGHRKDTTRSLKPESGLSRCTRCKVVKPFDEFYPCKTTHNGCQSHCKKCNVLLSSETRRRRTALIKEAKDKPCARCGESYPSYVMDLHHRDPATKVVTIGSDYGRLTKQQLLDEIEKCDVLCANCHRAVEHESSLAGGGACVRRTSAVPLAIL